MFHVGGHGRPHEEDNGALAHALWNLKNVDFSGVARSFGLEGHKRAKSFHVCGHGRPHEGAEGYLPTPSGIQKMLISVA